MGLSLQEKQLMQSCKTVKSGSHYALWLTGLLNRLVCALCILPLFPHCSNSQLLSYLLPNVLHPTSLLFLDLLQHTQFTIWPSGLTWHQSQLVNIHHQYSGKSQQDRLIHASPSGVPNKYDMLVQNTDGDLCPSALIGE